MQSPLNRIISRRYRLTDFEEIQLQYSNYIRRRRTENLEDEALIESEDLMNKNPNFAKEKEINFRLYPFYINWKKLEENQEGYFRIFVHFGYFGVAMYSLFKEKYPILNKKNILIIFSSFIPDLILKKKSKEKYIKEDLEFFFEKLPNIDAIYQLIQGKVIMLKEISIYLIVLKIYEIFFSLNDDGENMEKVLKCEFLLGNYLTEEEYENIYKEHFKGKVSKVFRKLEENRGKEYELAKTKNEFFSHIKFVYKKFVKKDNFFI